MIISSSSSTGPGPPKSSVFSELVHLFLSYAHTESTLHAIRDCFHARGIWEQVILSNLWPILFSLNWKEWLTRNQSNNGDN